MENNNLKGKPGQRIYQGIADIPIPGRKDVTIPGAPGKNIKTTLDIDLQQQVQKIIDETRVKHNANWGFSVIQDAKTGDVLALAETNSKSAGSSEVAISGSLLLKTLIEPGSTQKALTIAEEIDKGLHEPTDPFEVADKIQVSNGQVFEDAEKHDIERLTLSGCLAFSSNVCTVMSASNLTLKQRYNILSKYGFNKISGLGIQGESFTPLLPFKQWDSIIWNREHDLVTFGQGFTVNALKMTNSYSVFANNGILTTPNIIDGVFEGDKYVKTQHKTKRVIKEETASKMLKMLTTVVEKGNVIDIKIPGYSIAGKTGTSQMSYTSNKMKDFLASFISIFPADKPKYLVSTFFMNAHGAYLGATSAAPAVNKILKYIINKDKTPLSKRTDGDTYPVNW